MCLNWAGRGPTAPLSPTGTWIWIRTLPLGQHGSWRRGPPAAPAVAVLLILEPTSVGSLGAGQPLGPATSPVGREGGSMTPVSPALGEKRGQRFCSVTHLGGGPLPHTPEIRLPGSCKAPPGPASPSEEELPSLPPSLRFSSRRGKGPGACAPVGRLPDPEPWGLTYPHSQVKATAPRAWAASPHGEVWSSCGDQVSPQLWDRPHLSPPPPRARTATRVPRGLAPPGGREGGPRPLPAGGAPPAAPFPQRVLEDGLCTTR